MKSSCAVRNFSLALLAAAAVVSCSPPAESPGLSGATGAVPEVRTQLRTRASSTAPVIYVANMAGMKNGGTVTVYSGDGKLMRTLRRGITSPTAFAFDKLGDVYVLNSMPSGRSGSGGFVSVYSRGGKKFLGQIKNGIGAPVGLALDSSNNIYVANAASSNSPGNVVVFKAGTATLLGAITKGISSPTDIATDCNGKLYVLNGGNNTVTEYGGRHLKLMLTIHNMTISTGLMVTCQGNVFVSQSASTSAIKRYPFTATPTPTPSGAPSTSPSPSSAPSASPTPTPYSTPGGTVTEFASGSTIPLDTMPVDGGIPCNMASDPSSGMTWIEACAFSGTDTAMLYGYPEDESSETIAIPLPPFSANAQFLLMPPDGVYPQTTLAIPRTSTTGYDLRSNAYPYYGGPELLFYNTSGVQTQAVPEPTLGVAVAIASN